MVTRPRAESRHDGMNAALFEAALHSFRTKGYSDYKECRD